MVKKSDKRIELEEKLPTFFSDTHRVAYTTSEVMDLVDVDIDRRTYIDAMRDNDRIYEVERSGARLWIFPRMRQFRTLEERVSDLEDTIEVVHPEVFSR